VRGAGGGIVPIVGKGRASVGTVVAGLVAGMGYGMMEMVIEAVGGKGFWSPLRFIASVFTLGTDTDPSFALAPVFVGLMGHHDELGAVRHRLRRLPEQDRPRHRRAGGHRHGVCGRDPRRGGSMGHPRDRHERRRACCTSLTTLRAIKPDPQQLAAVIHFRRAHAVEAVQSRQPGAMREPQPRPAAALQVRPRSRSVTS